MKLLDELEKNLAKNPLVGRSQGERAGEKLRLMLAGRLPGERAELITL